MEALHVLEMSEQMYSGENSLLVKNGNLSVPVIFPQSQPLEPKSHQPTMEMLTVSISDVLLKELPL
jgi:hypothetical protein